MKMSNNKCSKAVAYKVNLATERSSIRYESFPQQQYPLLTCGKLTSKEWVLFEVTFNKNSVKMWLPTCLIQNTFFEILRKKPLLMR